MPQALLGVTMMSYVLLRKYRRPGIFLFYFLVNGLFTNGKKTDFLFAMEHPLCEIFGATYV